MDEIEVIVTSARCLAGGYDQIHFRHPELAEVFLRVLSGLMPPELFVSLTALLVPSPEAVEQAKQLINACMGVAL